MPDKPVIMIVDDDPDQLLLFVIAAQRTHAFSEVLTANSAQRAISLLTVRPNRVHRPDVILTDLRMPGTSGVELTEFLKSRDDTSDIPIVAMSDSDYEVDQAAAYAAGCTGFVYKPTNLHELQDVLRSLKAHCRPAQQVA